MKADLSPEELEELRALLETKKKTEESAQLRSKPAKSTIPLRKNKVFLALVALITVIALAFAWTVAVDPWLKLRAAEKELQNQINLERVIGWNSTMSSFVPLKESHILPGSNPKQLALGTEDAQTVPAYLEFRSANASEDSHVLELFIDFYSQRARDFIALNQDTLRGFLASGKIILRIHPVVQTDGFSIFAPEALSEVMATHPRLAWDFFVNLMKNSNEILSVVNPEEANAPTAKEIVAFIARISKDSGVPTGSPNGVDADSIKYLSFFSWLYAGGEDDRLQVGYYPPVLYINDKEVDQERYPLSDPEAFFKLLSSLG